VEEGEASLSIREKSAEKNAVYKIISTTKATAKKREKKKAMIGGGTCEDIRTRQEEKVSRHLCSAQIGRLGGNWREKGTATLRKAPRHPYEQVIKRKGGGI